MHSQDGREVTTATALGHFTLALHETGVLKEHHGKATHQGVVSAIVDTVGTARVGKLLEGGRQQRQPGCKRQTL